MSRRTQGFRDLGFSLLELVVVLAIFALVALVGAQVIRATVDAERRLTAVSESSGELALALALLRRDLRAGTPLPFYAPDGGGEPALLVASGTDGFALSVSGLAAAGAGLGRVDWRLDPGTGRLSRRVWTSLTPGSAQAVGPETVMLSDIGGLRIDSFSFLSGWQRGYAADPRTPEALPRALRVTLEHGRFGVLETLVTLQ